VFNENPKLTRPKDDAIIWHYMDLSKFIDMLDNGFHFRKAGALEDPYELSWLTVPLAKKPTDLNKAVRKAFDEMREDVYIFSWHINVGESAAFWKLYMKSEYGIAIQSTYSKLVKTLLTSSADTNFDIGEVGYKPNKVIQRIERKLDGGKFRVDLIDLIYTKRPCFEHERELRVHIESRNNPENDFYFPISIEAFNFFVEKIIVSPYPIRRNTKLNNKKDWVTQMIERISKKYGLSRPVEKSTLYTLPW